MSGMSGCRSPDEAGLHVTVEGPLEAGTDFDRLSLVTYLAEDATPLHLETLEGEALTLPAAFNLLAGPGTPAGTRVQVLASAEKAGRVVSSARGEGELLTGEGGRLSLTLPDVDAPPAPPPPTEACDDGLDNDGDGRADCGDPACAQKACGPVGTGMTCNDGVCGCGSNPLGQWREPLPGFTARTGARALRLEEGPRAGWLVFAGGTEADGPSRRLELFRPELSQLEQLNLSVARASPALAELPGGDLVIVGGAQAEHVVTHADYERVRFVASGGATLQPRVELQPALDLSRPLAFTAGEEVLFTGGALGERLVRIDAAASGGNDWTELPSLAAERDASARLLDGRQVLASGPVATATTEVVTPDGNVVAGPVLPVALSDAALAPTSNGRVLVVVGGASPSTRAFLIEVQGGVVAVRETSGLPAAIASARAVGTPSGWVYVVDGESGDAYWFDPAAEAFTRATPMPGPEREGDALVSPGGRDVLRLGGTVAGGGVDGSAWVIEQRCAP